MDKDFVDTIGNEWEDNKIHFCECGEKKSPDSPLCFMCSRQEREELDDWVKELQYRTKKWPTEPF